MLKTLNQNMLGLDHPFKVIAPLAAKYGFRAIYATRQMLEDRADLCGKSDRWRQLGRRRQG